MSQQVIWFATLKEAQVFEAKCLTEARRLGQVCDRWAEIITDKTLGYGVPVKDRIVRPEDRAKVREWTPPVIERAMV